MNPTTERNQAGQDQSDDPRQAIESGEPRIAGRSRGHVIDEKSSDDVEGASEEQRRKGGDNQDWESGRQQAV